MTPVFRLASSVALEEKFISWPRYLPMPAAVEVM